MSVSECKSSSGGPSAGGGAGAGGGANAGGGTATKGAEGAKDAAKGAQAGAGAAAKAGTESVGAAAKTSASPRSEISQEMAEEKEANLKSEAARVAAGDVAKDTVHTVQKGETLSGIAKASDVALKSVVNANPQIKNPDVIHPGDQVKVLGLMAPPAQLFIERAPVHVFHHDVGAVAGDPEVEDAHQAGMKQRDRPGSLAGEVLVHGRARASSRWSLMAKVAPSSLVASQTSP